MAQTAGYYHAAYIVAAAIYVLYTVSLAMRRKKVLARLAALERSSER